MMSRFKFYDGRVRKLCPVCKQVKTMWRVAKMCDECKERIKAEGKTNRR